MDKKKMVRHAQKLSRGSRTKIAAAASKHRAGLKSKATAKRGGKGGGGH